MELQWSRTPMDLPFPAAPLPNSPNSLPGTQRGAQLKLWVLSMNNLSLGETPPCAPGRCLGVALEPGEKCAALFVT